MVGSVLPGHVRSGWNARRNRKTGIAMLVVMGLLMLSGLLLYYGSEDAHDAVVLGHWVAGFMAVAAFPIHLIIGYQLNR